MNLPLILVKTLMFWDLWALDEWPIAYFRKPFVLEHELGFFECRNSAA